MPQSVTHGVNLVVRDVDRSDAAAIVGILNPIRAGPGRHGWQSKGASMTGITANGARIHAAALEEEAAAALRELQAHLRRADNPPERDALRAEIRAVYEELARKKRAEMRHSLF